MAEAIKVVGLAEVQRALKQMEVPGKEISQAGFDAAKLVADYAKARTVPVKTGATRNAIRPAKLQRGAVIRVKGTQIPYANPIHFGWFKRHILPNPYLYKALDVRIDEVYSAYFKQLSKLIDQVAGQPSLVTPTRLPQPTGQAGHIDLNGPRKPVI